MVGPCPGTFLALTQHLLLVGDHQSYLNPGSPLLLAQLGGCEALGPRPAGQRGCHHDCPGPACPPRRGHCQACYLWGLRLREEMSRLCSDPGIRPLDRLSCEGLGSAQGQVPWREEAGLPERLQHFPLPFCRAAWLADRVSVPRPRNISWEPASIPYWLGLPKPHGLPSRSGGTPRLSSHASPLQGLVATLKRLHSPLLGTDVGLLPRLS